MNGKQSKLIKKYATKMRYDEGYIRNEYAKLNSDMRRRFMAKIRTALEFLERNPQAIAGK